MYGEQWSRISKLLFKSMVKCHKRYLQLVGSKDDHAQKISWTQEEDAILTYQVSLHGTKNWKQVCLALPNRIHKQCRERWVNILSPSITKKKWTEEEDRKILELFYTYGPRWAFIAQRIPGRNDNQVKNRWNSNLKKRNLQDNWLNCIMIKNENEGSGDVKAPAPNNDAIIELLPNEVEENVEVEKDLESGSICGFEDACDLNEFDSIEVDLIKQDEEKFNYNC